MGAHQPSAAALAVVVLVVVFVECFMAFVLLSACQGLTALPLHGHLGMSSARAVFFIGTGSRMGIHPR